MTQNLNSQRIRLRITAIENPISAADENSAKVWFTVVAGSGNVNPRSFGVYGHELVNHSTPIITALKQCTGASSLEALIGKEIEAEIVREDDELLFNHFFSKGLIMKKAELAVERQLMIVQVVSAEEKVSKAGNEMIVVKCVAVPMGAPDDMEPTDPFSVYYLMSKDFAMEDLNRMQKACHARHWKNLPGREFQALVFVQNDFVRLWSIKPLEETKASTDGEEEMPF